MREQVGVDLNWAPTINCMVRMLHEYSIISCIQALTLIHLVSGIAWPVEIITCNFKIPPILGIVSGMDEAVSTEAKHSILWGKKTRADKTAQSLRCSQ